MKRTLGIAILATFWMMSLVRAESWLPPPELRLSLHDAIQAAIDNNANVRLLKERIVAAQSAASTSLEASTIPTPVWIACGSFIRVRDGWQARRESNPQPAVLETAALPIELLA